MGGRKTNTYLNLLSVKLLLTELAKKPKTQPELIEATGLANSTVSRWLRLLKVKPNLVYIEDWRRVGSRGNWSAVWGFGYMLDDKPKPRPKTSADYNRTWRLKNARAARIERTDGSTIHRAD